MKKYSVLTMMLCLLLLGGVFLSSEALARTVIFAAVYGGDNPGIWRVEDRNADGDALDNSESYLFASLSKTKAIDVSIDKDGILYVIGEKKNSVYRIEDKNMDGDALDVGEVTIFRDLDGLGLTLEGPLSIGVINEWSAELKQSQTVVYVMDLTLQLLIRLTDRNGDSDAQESDEICLLLRNTAETPFTANRLIVDHLGKVIACNPNNRTLVLLDNLNNDCSINPPLKEIPCPPVPAGCVRLHQEYQSLYTPGPSKILLRDPYGVDLDSQGNFYVSEHTHQEYRVVKLTDNNGDGDISDIDEAIPYYVGASIKGFDIVVDPDDIVFLGQQTSGGTVLTRIEDLNDDGDARDAGEAVKFADFKGGLPLGLAIVMPPPPTLEIIPQLVDASPNKGPLLVVENGAYVELTLRILQSDTRLPLSGVQVGYQVMAGCLALCPLESRTNADGYIKFGISRLTSSPEGGEELRFWVYGHEVIIPVVSTACSPAPIAVAGPDRAVPSSQTVILDGSASIGAGLHYCWIQTGGPSVGLPACDETSVENPSVSFIAPGTPATLQFELNVRNACDVFSKGTVTVSVDDNILIVNPAYQQVANAAGSTMITISNSGTGIMNWSAKVVSGNDWLSITSGSSGTNAGIITSAFSANPNQSSRTGTIEVTAPDAVNSPGIISLIQAGSANLVGVEPGFVTIAISKDELVELMINSSNRPGDTPMYEWLLFMAVIDYTTPAYLFSDKGVIELNNALPNLYEYTFSYFEKDDLTHIATLTMADFGFQAGDTFVYAYAYQNQYGIIILENIVVITVY